MKVDVTVTGYVPTNMKNVQSKRFNRLKRHFILARIHLQNSSQTTVELSQRLQYPTSLRLCFAFRRAIDKVLLDCFGDISGSTALQYDMLLCREDCVESDSCIDFLSWSLVLSTLAMDLNKLLCALSFVGISFGGGELLPTLFDLAGYSRTHFIMYIDVLGVYDTLFEVPFEHSILAIQ
ncbi:unnamed protein product [Dicrocoelium dendriticum]|nr:unnamed protein product [Dicrocoelium dendriticum]